MDWSTPTPHCRIADWRGFSFADVCPRDIDDDVVMRTEYKSWTQCRSALQRVVNFAKFVALCQQVYFQALVQALVVSQLDYGNGVVIAFFGRPLFLSDAATAVGSQCGLCCWSFAFGGLITSRMRSSAFTGCEFPSASSSRSLFSSTKWTVHHRTSGYLPSRPTYL